MFLNIRNPKTHDWNGELWSDATDEDALQKAEQEYIEKTGDEELLDFDPDYSQYRMTTDDFSRKARNEGHDGAIMYRVYDEVSGDNTTNDTDNYTVFDPSQIKSADAVTYDDAGNVIPLSERFNSGSPDTRWSARAAVTPAEDAAEWGDLSRSVKVVGVGVPSWKYVKGTKVSEHKAALETMAYANIEAQPNHEIDPETGNHCLVIDGTRIRISKSGLFHGADRRLQNIGNAIANIGDVLNNSVSVPNISGEYSYRIAEADFGRPELVLVTLKNIDGNSEVVDLKRIYSVNVKAGNAAQSTTSTSVPRLTEDSIANLRDAWQLLFKPGIEAHEIAKRDSEYLDAVKRGDTKVAERMVREAAKVEDIANAETGRPITPRLCHFEFSEIAISANGDGALAQLVAIILM